ncbi:ribonuclease inhibitor-like protein [Leptomonas pyrrhocoris]|uniref:Ribonuclease inhibitor-like protein n=1 Tax=Leptomonas pyrrhocoris TaxID=157538 RepID=A0A0M9G2B0_LEPPY|nr:ribonuclease inhibitor-like protein [Leptomonas pyrrhocoris]XP_015659156.1 ribonuclease inhibitor-like protein [Leptomonas pyrrhocoris]KPA80716.1 ribonuclease inhibitor-like protein [Leptomonas pyrrhocoris]KPA80717.1 ribonuclease inhibitor-like protein [Leptomonas pyrrhocoris]|eukprot:XP_015659155.1 ribonuclease inhibitor-like protein [Leptomonas pyrrhocoris]
MDPSQSVSVFASASAPFPATEGKAAPLLFVASQGFDSSLPQVSRNDYKAQLYNFKCTKGRAFLQDRQAAVTSLPRLLPDGVPYAANFVSFDRLRECGALSETRQNEVSITAEDLRLLYEARCLDQDLAPSWQREVRFMELVSANCKGNFFCLPENGFGVSSAEALAAILSTNRRYSVLDVSGNRLRDEGARFIAQLLKKNRTLVHIDVASNDIGHTGGVMIAHALLENNTVVSLDIGARAGVNGNHIGTPGAEAFGMVLKSNEVLSRLNVSSNGLGAAGVTFIANALSLNHSLKRLNLSSNSLEADGARVLAAVLEESQVTHWELPRNRLDDKGGAVFLDALVEAVRNGHDVVEYLDMEDNVLGVKSAEAAGKLLSSSTALTVLRLAANSLESGVKAISAGLQENHSLTTLSLSKCSVDHSGAAALGHAIAVNRTLLHLDMSNNRIKDAGAVELAKGLGSNKCLLSCNVSSNKIGHEGGLEIARALQKNATLRHLNLRRNMMLEATGDAISDALRLNKSVEQMDVAYNDFSYVCVMAIERALEHNQAVNKTLLVPKLQSDIDRLAPKEKELDRAEEDIEVEKRMVRDRSEELMRRGEEARVVSEKLRREITELEKVYEKMRAAADTAEDAMRQTENRVNLAMTELKTKRANMETRIQQEKERADRFQRDTEKLRKQIKHLEDAEKEQLGPLLKDLEITEQDRTREMDDAKFEAEKLATLQMRMKELQIAANKGKKKKA